MKSKIFLRPVEIGIKHKFPHWDSTNVGILGIAIADLLMNRLNYELDSVSPDQENVDEILKKLIKLSFLFLTRRLEVSSSDAHDIYMKRAYLLQNYGAALHGEMVDNKEEVISDHYYSSLSFSERRFDGDSEKQLNLAKLLLQKYNPEQNTEATMDELHKTAEEGMLKNFKLYNDILKEYQEDKLDIEADELENYFANHENLAVA